MMTPMIFERRGLRLLDQRRLPAETIWVRCVDVESVAQAIEVMVVRGAPAIGCTAAFAMAVDASAAEDEGLESWQRYRGRFLEGLERLARTRPTAVNLFWALDRMRSLADTWSDATPMAQVAERVRALAQRIYDDDLATCRAIGVHGATLADAGRLRILTHCNAGALATAGYGTALGVVRSLAAAGKIEMVYADETRPYLQGARLTAYELSVEGIPHKVVADAAAAHLLGRRMIDLVIVGADRIAANGDTANKIGTYGLAVQCAYHGVPFYVAAPFSTFDLKTADGAGIPVEERGADEIRSWAGRLITPKDAGVYNPSFDVTPAGLITGIVTEKGILRAPYAEAIARVVGSP